MSSNLESRIKTLEEVMQLLTQVINTEKRLDRLAETVERFISEGRNGHA